MVTQTYEIEKGKVVSTTFVEEGQLVTLNLQEGTQRLATPTETKKFVESGGTISQPKELPKEMTIQRVGETPAGGVIVEKRDEAGELVGRETIVPKKWEAMRIEYIASMTPEEREAFRIKQFKELKEAKKFEIGGIKYTSQEYKEREEEIERRLKDPVAGFMWGISRPITIFSGLAGAALISPIKGAKGFEAVAKGWKEERLAIERTMLYEPKRRGEIALTMAVEPAVVGASAAFSMVAPKLPVIGKLLAKPVVATTISAGVGAYGGYEFVTQMPEAMKLKPEAIKRVGMGAGLMALGAYGTQKGLEAMFPKGEPKVMVTTLGKGKALQKVHIGKKEFTGIKTTKLIGKAGTRKFIGKSIADYGAKLKGQKFVEGYGQTFTGIREIKGLSFKQKFLKFFGKDIKPTLGKPISRHDLFVTKAGVIDKSIIYSQTVYGKAKGAKISSIFHRGKEGRMLAEGGIRLAMGKMKVKGFETLTKITQWYKHYPKQTASIMAGKKWAGAEITDISHIIAQPPTKITIVKPTIGAGTKLTVGKITTGVGETTTQISKASMKNIISGIVVAPKAATTTFITPIITTAPSIKIKTRTISPVKLDIKPIIKTKTKTKTKTISGVRLGTTTITKTKAITKTKTATRLGVGLITIPKTELSTRLDIGMKTRTGMRLDTLTSTETATRLDTRLAARLDTKITTPTITTPVPPPSIPPFPPIIIPPLGLGGSLKGRRRRGIVSIKRKKKYTPSIGGIFLKTKFKKPKLELGLRMRGIKKGRK